MAQHPLGMLTLVRSGHRPCRKHRRRLQVARDSSDDFDARDLLQLADLLAGIYLVAINSGGQSFTEKVVKE